MKKFLALILASLMLVGCFGCFAGCNRDTSNETPDVSATDPVPSESDVPDEPVVDEPVVDTSATDVSASNVSATDVSASDVGVVNIEGEGEYLAFLAVGADKYNDTEWANSWSGEDTAKTGVTANAAKVNAGDSVTLSVEFAEPVAATWYVAPCIVIGEGKTVDATVTAVRVDGKDITNLIDFSAGDAVWNEETGPFAKAECVRIAGGFNNWGAQYLTADLLVDYSKIEFDVTINSIA